jgi:hypothetical protein
VPEIKNCIIGAASNSLKGKRKIFHCEDDVVEKSKKSLAKTGSPPLRLSALARTLILKKIKVLRKTFEVL